MQARIPHLYRPPLPVFKKRQVCLFLVLQTLPTCRAARHGLGVYTLEKGGQNKMNFWIGLLLGGMFGAVVMALVKTGGGGDDEYR